MLLTIASQLSLRHLNLTMSITRIMLLLMFCFVKKLKNEMMKFWLLSRRFQIWRNTKTR